MRKREREKKCGARTNDLYEVHVRSKLKPDLTKKGWKTVQEKAKEKGKKGKMRKEGRKRKEEKRHKGGKNFRIKRQSEQKKQINVTFSDMA